MSKKKQAEVLIACHVKVQTNFTFLVSSCTFYYTWAECFMIILAKNQARKRHLLNNEYHNIDLGKTMLS